MKEAPLNRRLAAVMAADVAGYTRLMGENEEETLAALVTHMDELITPEITGNQGRIVKTTGDGLLAEFSSVLNAVRCALEIQERMIERNSEVPAERQINFRIGINLGDIIIHGDDIFGDGVNLAARLEAFTKPGSVCISEKVFEELSNKLKVAFHDLGEQTFKNISAPVRVYGVTRDTSPDPVGSTRSLEDKPAVAVLPFENRSKDAEQEYFSDGLSEDIITLLAAWRSFPVVARNSSFAFKGQAIDVREVAKALSARYVIEGSVRKSGTQVRVTTQLIDAETGHHLWARKFDGSLDDIFEIQDQITRQIVSAIEPEMEQAERNRSRTKRSDNLSAWDYYLRARAELHKITPQATKEARSLFEKAIQLDPAYSDAFGGLSMTYQRDIMLEVAQDRPLWEEEAIRNAKRAVELDFESSLAHYTLSGAYIWANKHDLSIPEIRLAAELNPSNVPAQLALGNRLDIVGNAAEGIPLLEKSLDLHPRDPHSHIYFAQLARAYINAREYEKARACLRESIARNPDYPHSYHILAICLGHLGEHEEANKAAQKCNLLHPGFIEKRAKWNIYTDPEANEHLTEGLRKAGVV